MARLRNPHPGEILKEEFLSAIRMSQNQLAHTVGVPGNRIHAIVNGTRDITGDTDLCVSAPDRDPGRNRTIKLISNPKYE